MTEEFKGFEGLVKIMKRLRGPDGCPWDREQSKESLKPYVIEEAYEVVEAIDEGDISELKEELGDLLLQVVFLSELSDEAGDFKIDDVIAAISEKLVRRHPHVFGEETSNTSEEVVKSWASIKIDEKKEKGKKSVLEGVPCHMPALLRAHRIAEKAARVGFDWSHIDEVFKKLEEELGEFEEALASKDIAKVEDELGDVIFALVNISRFLEVNPEEALKKTVRKFVSRFNYIEEGLERGGLDIRDASLEEMERLWEEAKEAEGR
ncbi:MAG: nucleoside triphosphate pyrophosphohydrolase [Deltaproteobacteria bacterium]|nr:nucleoside triphosphate pyrophosphohydrolase [Deltaproteobacteria bacterium]